MLIKLIATNLLFAICFISAAILVNFVNESIGHAEHITINE